VAWKLPIMRVAMEQIPILRVIAGQIEADGLEKTFCPLLNGVSE